MDRGRLAQAADEYRQLFQFFFVFRAIALLFGLIWILFKLSRGENLLLALIIWVGVLLYTVAIYMKRQKLFAIVLEHPAYLGVDILVSVAILMAYSAVNTPFYFYSISPVIPAAVMFRFKGATISGSILSAGQIASLFVHGATPQDIFSLQYFPLLFGQIAAYFTVAYMCIYPADMIAEIVRQRSVIKKQSAKEAVSEERTRLARELHDNLTQMLSAIKLKADALSKPSSEQKISASRDICELSSSALLDLRNAIFSLRPENIEHDLGRMLTDYCRRFPSTMGCEVETFLSVDGMNLASEQKYEMLRICQEALSNAARHSGTSSVKLEAKKEDTGLTISIEDNGLGFDPDKTEAGVGLSSMRERATKLGGTLEIISSEGGGTKVKLTVPLENLEKGTL